MKTYIHYGHAHYDKALFCPIRNIPYFTKPAGGLWASNIRALYGWKDWNKETDFKQCKEENSFTFCLKRGSRVLTIKSAFDLLALEHERFAFIIMLDYEKLAQSYDAIEVIISADRELYYSLYGWDCDSILVLNPDAVEEIKRDV